MSFFLVQNILCSFQFLSKQINKSNSTVNCKPCSFFFVFWMIPNMFPHKKQQRGKSEISFKL